MANDLIRHFFGGFVRLHILYHAAKDPVCGVEMIDELRRHGYKLSPGTLYPILHSLDAGKYVSCAEKTFAGKRRKYYTITPKGQKLLVEAQAKLRELFSEVVEDHDRMASAGKSPRHRD